MEVLRRHARKRSRKKRQLLPYHTSALSGEDWVQELIHGHPNRIKTELRMHLHVDTPQAPSKRVDRSRPKLSDVYRSSTQNADATTLRTLKVDDILLSILTIATPGDRGLSQL
jgi:hypothetical protein